MLIETRRVKYWQQQEDYDDAWLYFEQIGHTAYTLPAGTLITTAAGPIELHDDRLLSAALMADLDRLATASLVSTGRAESVTIPSHDPLHNLKF